jgi:hypothetical protein
MKFNVRERLQLLSLLPKEGSYVTLKVVRILREELSFDADELIALDFKEPGEEYEDEAGNIRIVPAGQLRWKQDADKPKEIEMEPARHNMIFSKLKGMDDREKLTDDLFPLYEKFLGG